MTAQARARRTDPATSFEAAKKVEKEGKAQTQRRRCLELVTAWPGQTAAEYASRLGLERHIPSRRLPELREEGWIESGNPRPCRIMGTKAMTWWPTEGQKFLQGRLDL